MFAIFWLDLGRLHFGAGQGALLRVSLQVIRILVVKGVSFRVYLASWREFPLHKSSLGASGNSASHHIGNSHEPANAQEIMCGFNHVQLLECMLLGPHTRLYCSWVGSCLPAQQKMRKSRQSPEIRNFRRHACHHACE